MVKRPNYSSHSCAASLTVEIADVSVAAQESTKLYALLQTAVDNEIQQVGFMPDATTYGMNNGNGAHPNGSPARNGNGHSNGNGYANGNGRHAAPVTTRNGDHWNCTDGQRGFILRIIAESSLTKQDVEEMAQQLFGAGVTSLDKMQASQLIEDLLVKVGKPAPRQTRWQQRPTAQAA